MKNLALALALVGFMTFGISACGGNDAGDGAADTAATNGTTSTTGGEETADAGEVKTYTFHGVVTGIDRDMGMIKVDHEKIGDWMEAMEMPFKVADPALLDQVKVGDSTHFTLRVSGSDALITKVEKEHAEGEAH